jgi:hypothetical protein
MTTLPSLKALEGWTCYDHEWGDVMNKTAATCQAMECMLPGTTTILSKRGGDEAYMNLRPRGSHLQI